jgi:hypothetical protein
MYTPLIPKLLADSMIDSESDIAKKEELKEWLSPDKDYWFRVKDRNTTPFKTEVSSVIDKTTNTPTGESNA